VIGRAGLSLLATVAIAVSSAACTSRGDAASIDRSSGPLAEQSYQWSAGPDVDLTAGPAVPIRAYIESRLDAQTMGNLDYAYPGFDRAVAPVTDDDRGDILKNNLRPDVDRGPVEKPPVGDNLFRIQVVTRAGATATATLCNYRYRTALENDNGSFSSVASTFRNDDGIDAMRLTLTAPSNGESQLPRQAGPAVAPTVDVFGSWQISSFLTSWFDSDSQFAAAWPTYEADLAKCVAEAPDPPDRRAFLIDGQHPRSAFPTSPPMPGWPEPSK
jgi:hypothetical protein